MYIEPNSNIRILRNCPLNAQLDHTLYFTSKEAQTSYFMSLSKYSFTEQTYTRPNKGLIRVERKAEDLYDCNYLMFQNQSFGNKWFYAFINKVNYINNVTSELEFEIDSLQTYLFDFSLKECFVEREHTTSDKIGEHILDEGLDFGDYLYNHLDIETQMDDMAVLVCAPFKWDGTSLDPTEQIQLYQGIPQGVTYTAFDATPPYKSINTYDDEGTYHEVYLPTWLNAGPANNILEMYLINKCFISKPDSVSAAGFATTVPKYQSSIGSYTPKNKKLFCYPYNFLRCVAPQGQTADFRYEFFSSAECTFQIRGTINLPCQATLIPHHYKNSVKANPHEALTMQGYPQVTWQTDTFLNYASQALSTVIPIASEAAGGGLFMGKAGIEAGVGISLLKNVDQIMKGVVQYDSHPRQVNGQINQPTLSASMGWFRFFYYNMQITEDYARIIDDYFTRFGYACKRTKQPNVNARPHYTYTKTLDCKITGSMPQDDIITIQDRFNQGITFWKYPNEVGNYSVDNRV